MIIMIMYVQVLKSLAHHTNEIYYLLAALPAFIITSSSIIFEQEKKMFKSLFSKIRLTLPSRNELNMKDNALYLEHLAFEEWLIILPVADAQ